MSEIDHQDTDLTDPHGEAETLRAERDAMRAGGFAAGWAAAIEAAVDFIESAPCHWTRSRDARAIRAMTAPDNVPSNASNAFDRMRREARAQALAYDPPRLLRREFWAGVVIGAVLMAAMDIGDVHLCAGQCDGVGAPHGVAP